MNQSKVYTLVIEHIKMLVKKGEISFGGKLPSERQLMATLGLSRNSIREALRSLENMGIVESRHGQGNFLVNHLDQSLGSIFSLLLFMKECSVNEVHQLRRSIEISAYLLAVKQVQGEQIQELSDCFDALADSRADERAALDQQFHDTLIKFSENRMFILLNDTLSQLYACTIQEQQAHLSPDDWGQLLSCHARIVSCLAKREAAAGIHAITEHYELIEHAG
ncbi:MAG: GntR family transcriptional regulator [Lachnospiraceae bacterium]|nr:GntR family transcriptional regulator [Lachnospiraceae bacterium]